jgi:hypothetical protein
MVFVHARKETVKSGLTIHEQAQKEGNAADFDCSDNPRWEQFRRDIGMTSKNKEMKQLFEYGIGIHHAGMLRSDRNLTERAFETGALKVRTRASPVRPYWVDLVFNRSSAARRLWLGVSTCRRTQSLSRGRRSTMRRPENSRISQFWTSCRCVRSSRLSCGCHLLGLLARIRSLVVLDVLGTRRAELASSALRTTRCVAASWSFW